SCPGSGCGSSGPCRADQARPPSRQWTSRCSGKSPGGPYDNRTADTTRKILPEFGCRRGAARGRACAIIIEPGSSCHRGLQAAYQRGSSEGDPLEKGTSFL